MAKDKTADEHRRKSFINTAPPRTGVERRRHALNNELDPEDLEEKLKSKIHEQKHLYDFKYIKKKFKTPE